MQNLVFAFNAIAPLFIQIVLGFFLKKKKVIDQHFIDISSSFAFKYLFPLIVFRQIYQIDIAANINPVFIGYGIVVCLVLALLLCLIVPRFIHEKRTCGAFIQGSYRGNNVLMGVALAIKIFGDEDSLPTIMLLPFAVIMLNIVSLIILTAFSPDNKKVSIKTVLPEVIKNPIVRGAVCGVIVSLLGIKIPVFLRDVIDDLAAITTPLALIALGGQLEVKNLFEKAPLIFAGSFIKLVLSPLIAIVPALIFFHFSPSEMGALYVIFGSSSAVSSFVMAKAMKSDDDLAGLMVVYSTILASITMFLWLYILKSFQII